MSNEIKEIENQQSGIISKYYRIVGGGMNTFSLRDLTQLYTLADKSIDELTNLRNIIEAKMHKKIEAKGSDLLE